MQYLSFHPASNECMPFSHIFCICVIYSELESEVEMLRLDVVQKRCIANPSEVDSLNSQLGIISRQVSDLKSKSGGHMIVIELS